MAAIAAAANETWEYDCSVINNIMKYTIWKHCVGVL